MKSRLRRAFSFGSAAELRRASAENNISVERAKLRKDQYQSVEDAEQAAIIAKQEAAGIGAGIYSGQGGIGSTDNLSIQSAASSASVMLRKMGHGMKKGTKSIKGLFRPKSVIGVPAADGPIRPSVGQVSLVTVEAERQKVNVNANPNEHARGGTGYPRLERNSIDAGQTAEIVDPSAPGGDTTPRKSIVGSDRDRAEVLSSMKKGILKRRYTLSILHHAAANHDLGPGTNSPAGSPVIRPVDAVPNVGSSRSSSPATPRTEAGQIRNDDYFTKPPRIHNGSTRSLPTTPHGGMRNISFSPRIQFHDAWSPQDYDRRGDIATCNRLTPMLAQQIKEELNSFKMVRIADAVSPTNTNHVDRRWKFTSSRNPTPISSNDICIHHLDLASWRIPLSSLHLWIGAISIYQLSALFHVLVTTDLFFHLSEHLKPRRGRTLCLHARAQQGVLAGREPPKKHSKDGRRKS